MQPCLKDPFDTTMRLFVRQKEFWNKNVLYRQRAGFKMLCFLVGCVLKGSSIFGFYFEIMSITFANELKLQQFELRQKVLEDVFVLHIT